MDLEEKLNLKIFDPNLNLIKVVPLQSMVQPRLYLLAHVYWLDQHLNSWLLSGDMESGLLYFHDFHYSVHLKKNTGHADRLNIAAFSPNSLFLLCTVSNDGLVKIWDWKKYFIDSS
jgi:WD40 repeat protein